MNFTLNSQEVNLDYLEKDEKLIVVNSSPLWRKIYTLSIPSVSGKKGTLNYALISRVYHLVTF